MALWVQNKLNSFTKIKVIYSWTKKIAEKVLMTLEGLLILHKPTMRCQCHLYWNLVLSKKYSPNITPCQQCTSAPSAAAPSRNAWNSTVSVSPKVSTADLSAVAAAAKIWKSSLTKLSSQSLTSSREIPPRFRASLPTDSLCSKRSRRTTRISLTMTSRCISSIARAAPAKSPGASRAIANAFLSVSHVLELASAKAAEIAKHSLIRQMAIPFCSRLPEAEILWTLSHQIHKTSREFLQDLVPANFR